jgi:TatD DNase family protein
MWIDSHCHLNHENIGPSGSPEEIVARARAAGVDGMVNISTMISGDFQTVLATAKAIDNVWCTIGTHPHDAGVEAEKAVTLDQIIATANAEDKIVGIGESGLDYFYNHSTPKDQAVSFRKHIQACIATDLPLVVHARDADDDIIKIIREEGGRAAGLRGVLHCFSSGQGLAEKALEEGFYISFSGIVTFNKSKELQEIAKVIPLDRILVETDAPFLAPMPFRGKLNEPAYVQHTGQFLANLLSISEKDVATHSKNNFFDLFTKAKLS